MAVGPLNPELVLRARDETRAAFTTVQRSLGGLQSQAAGFARAFSTIGGLLGAGAFAGTIRSTINLADELEELAQKTGVSVERLSALKYAGELSGATFEDLQLGLRNLSLQVDRGSDAFKRLRIDPAQFRDNADLLLAVADRFAKLEDGAGKTAIAVELFGRSGEQLIPFLNQGAAGLRALSDEAARAGVIISADLARAAAEFNDSIDRLGAQARGAGIQIANGLLPFLNEIVTQLNEGIRIAGSFGEAIRTLGTINPFRSVAGNIRTLSEELERLREAQAQPRGFGTSQQTFDEIQRQLQGQIERTSRQLEFLRAQQQRQALGGGRDVRDPRDLRLEQERRAGEQRARVPVREEQRKTRTRDEFAEIVQQLERERQSIAQLTAEQRILEEVEAKRIKLTPDQERKVRGLVAEVEQRRVSRQTLEEEAAAEQALFDTQLDNLRRRSDFAEDFRQEEERQRQEVERTAEAYRQLADPTRRYRQELEEIARLQASGALGAEEAVKARQAIEKEIDAIENKTSDVAKSLGLTFSSAIEDAIVQMRDLGDVVDAVFQDILRLAVRKSITEPLFEAVGGLFSGGGGGAGFVGELAKMFGFAHGGIMTPRGPLALESYAMGGIAGRPTLALFGEGRRNEAFVPLPDGRSIPVQMRGGQQGVVVNMNVYAQDADSFRRSRRQILGELRSQLKFA